MVIGEDNRRGVPCVSTKSAVRTFHRTKPNATYRRLRDVRDSAGYQPGRLPASPGTMPSHSCTCASDIT